MMRAVVGLLVVAMAGAALGRAGGRWEARDDDDNRTPKDKDEPYCEKDDVRYKVGDLIPTLGNCHHCTCVGQAQIICMRVVCPYPMCVDYIKGPKDCCATCPNGLNCWLGGEKMLGGHRRMQPLPNDPLCWRECFCPGAAVYSRQRNETKAECSDMVVCA